MSTPWPLPMSVAQADRGRVCGRGSMEGSGPAVPDPAVPDPAVPDLAATGRPQAAVGEG